MYDSQIIKEYLLYPQQTGTLSIEPADITAVAQVVMRTNRAFDPFFGGGRELYNVRRELRTPRLTVTVNELPAGAPSSFGGAVGKFQMEATPSATQLAANSASTFNVRISGSGNLAFVQEPTLKLPTSFELYQVKSSESFKYSGSGTSGYRNFEYPFIARAEGEYDVPPIEFTFFNPEKQSYITLSSAPLTLNISPDGSAGAATPAQLITGTSKEGVRQLGSDIRFIKMTRPQLSAVVAPFILSPLYFMVLLLLVLLAVVAYFVVSKRIRDNKNTALVKGRRANKVAIQRFRAAERYMREQNRRAFYEEMLRALWGYLSDRFNIPVADLTKESVREELNRRGATEEAKDVTAIISQCEEAQYSPIESVTMDQVYGKGIEIVSRIESIAKK